MLKEKVKTHWLYILFLVWASSISGVYLTIKASTLGSQLFLAVFLAVTGTFLIMGAVLLIVGVLNAFQNGE